MIRRFVQEEKIRVGKKQFRERQPVLFASGKGSGRLRELLSAEANTEQRGLGTGFVAVPSSKLKFLLKLGVAIQYRGLGIMRYRRFHLLEPLLDQPEIVEGTERLFQDRLVAEVRDLIQSLDPDAVSSGNRSGIGVVRRLDESE